MKRSLSFHAIVFCLILHLTLASVQTADGQQPQPNGSDPAQSNKELVDALFQQLDIARQRELNAVIEAHERELRAPQGAHQRELANAAKTHERQLANAAEAHERQLATTAQAHQRELSAATAELTAAQNEIALLQQENRVLAQKMEQLRDEVEKWKRLASRNFMAMLEKIKERSAELAAKNRDEATDISQLEERKRQAQLEMTQAEKQLSSWEEVLAKRKGEYLQHQELVGRARSQSPNASSYSFRGERHQLPRGENTSQRMDELATQIQSISTAAEKAKSTYGNYANEFERLHEKLASSKAVQTRRRKQWELLEDAYDQVLLNANKLPRTEGAE